ncbi:unnamed protein product [Callosobruchus maculatus]|uniref:Uncharacterized protein n=1 Tax=Callosobruchus maculatus TaxID=64391 RepID=A0A653CYF9_CALMS|nr:unnamed protein product [Callosobruchus maculatus]
MYNVPRRPQHNYSIDIDLEEEEYERHPSVPVILATYQPVAEYEPQPTVDEYDSYSRPVQSMREVQYQHPRYNIPDRTQYNYSVDIDLEEEEYWRQPGVPVSQPPYQPVEEYEPQPTVDYYDPSTRPIQPIREAQHQHPKFKIPDRPQYNYSIDIDLEEEEYWRQPGVPVSQPTYQPVEEYEPQPTVDEYDPYTRPIQPIREAQHQHTKLKIPDRPQYNYSIDIDLEEEEYWRQPSAPVSQPTYGVQLTEYEDKFANQPQLYVEDLHQSIEPPNYQRVRGHKLQSHRPDGSLYEKYSTPSSVMKKMEYEEQPELYEPYHPNGPGYDTELEDQPQPVVDQPSLELDWIDSDEQTPMYITRPVSVENTVNSLQSILQRFVTGEQPLASLPNVIRSVGAVHRIRIDIKISIEKIVGTLVGYNPGLYDIVRQVHNLVSPILPNIPDENSPGPHGTSTVLSVLQNTHRIISEVVKVILNALRHHHPSLLRVFRDVLPKLFRAVFLPSSAPPQVILKHVVSLVKLLEPIWDKLPHQATLSPPELVYHLYRIIKLIRQLVDVDKSFPQIPRDTSQANPLDGAMRKIYYLLKRDGDCVNRETVVQFSREIQNLKSAFPKIPASALKALQAQLPELVLSLKNSCSNSLIHRYVKDLESSLFRYWGIQEKEDLPDDLFVQPILKSIRLHDLEQDLWDNLGDYLAALVGPSASASLRASLAKLNGLIKRFFKRMIINEPNDYEVKSVALRISNLLAGALSIPYKIFSLLRSLVIGGLQLIRDVIHGRREVHNVEDIIYGAANKIGGILSGSPIYQIMSHLPLMKLRGNILNSINQYTKQIADYQKSIRKFVAKLEVLKGVNKPTSRPLEQLLYRLPPIVKEMTTCSDILPYKSYDYFHKLLSSLSGRAIPRDLSYKLVNLISQVRGQRCADHVSLPESLGHLDAYLPGQSFKKWHAKFATRKVFTQVAFASSVNVRLNNHLLYTIQHLLGTIQPHVVTNQQTAGEFVNSVRDWASSLEHTINQPQQRHSVKRSVFVLSAKFTAILRPQQKQPPQELTDKLMGLSNSIWNGTKHRHLNR